MLYRSKRRAEQLSRPTSTRRTNNTILSVSLSFCFIVALLGTGIFFATNNTIPTTHAAPTDTLPGVGINFDSPSIGGNKVFADAMKSSRPYWAPVDDVIGSGAPVDANGWPTADASILVWEGVANNHGTYKLLFNGQATVVASQNQGTISQQSYDAATNTTTATLIITDTGAQNFGLIFTNTKRTASSATNTGVTNVRLFRPTSPGSATPFAENVIFTPWVKTAMSAYSYIRFMPGTNWNTSTTWSDRTRASDASQQKVLPGESGFEKNNIAYEYMVILANETGKDIYINIPHKANNDYITKLAQLLKYGSDGINPYTSPQANPLFAPLHSDLKVYIEYSNELWNYGFQQAHDVNAMAKAEVQAGNSPLNWDGETSDIVLGWRYPVKRTVEISNIFRGVFGNDTIGTRIRPLLFWQYDNMNNTASIMLEFLNTYYNNADGIQHVNDPHPPTYYVWGAGGAAYYNSGNDNAATVDELFASGFPRFGGEDIYQKMLNTQAAWARSYGLHYVVYEGGWAVGGDFGATQIAMQAKRDPRAKQTMFDSFNAFTRAGGDLYTAGTYSQWDDITQAESHPLWQAENEITNGSFTSQGFAQGTVINASGATISGSNYNVRSDYNTNSGATTSVGRSAGYLLRVTEGGNYNVALQVGSAASGGKINVFVDGQLVSTIDVPNTGSTSNHQLVNAGSVTLSTGAHSILLRGVAPAGGNAGEVASIQIGAGGSGTTPTPTPTVPAGVTPTPTPPPTGTTSYLSDLNWTSANAGYGSVQLDKSSAGNTLTLRGQTYSKGIGTHAVSEIHYNLNGQYKTFSASIGVDDEAWSNGSVVFQVFGDGTKLYDSGIVNRDDAIKSINIDVSGVSDLTLYVGDAGNGNGSDHADWADAKVSK